MRCRACVYVRRTAPACRIAAARRCLTLHTLCLQASFYVSYILTNATVAKGIAFLRIPGFLIYLLLSRLSGTKRQKKKTWSTQYVQYGTELPDHTITVLLLLVFGVAQPFVALIALMYFVFVFFYTRYNLLYVKRERYQTGGLFWPVARASRLDSLHVCAWLFMALCSLDSSSALPTAPLQSGYACTHAQCARQA
jgi:Calcium-dependent channel, 7TM region, putative phosphate